MCYWTPNVYSNFSSLRSHSFAQLVRLPKSRVCTFLLSAFAYLSVYVCVSMCVRVYFTIAYSCCSAHTRNSTVIPYIACRAIFLRRSFRFTWCEDTLNNADLLTQEMAVASQIEIGFEKKATVANAWLYSFENDDVQASLIFSAHILFLSPFTSF